MHIGAVSCLFRLSLSDGRFAPQKAWQPSHSIALVLARAVAYSAALLAMLSETVDCPTSIEKLTHSDIDRFGRPPVDSWGGAFSGGF